MIDLNKKYSVKELVFKGVLSPTVVNYVNISKTFESSLQGAETQKEAIITTAQKHKCSTRTVKRVVYDFVKVTK